MRQETVWLGAISSAKTDPRPLKANLSLLRSGYNVEDLLINKKETPKKTRLYSITQLLFWGCMFHLRIYRSKSARAFLDANLKYPIKFSSEVKNKDVLLLFDLDLLPFAVHSFPSHRIILDFREIYTEQYGRNLKFLLFLKPIRHYVLKNHANHLSAGYTVSRGLVDFYLKEFNLKLELIRSLPIQGLCQSSLNNGHVLRLVYLGGAHPLRGLHESIKAVISSQSNIEFHLYLVGDANYIAYLERIAKKSKRIFIHPPVEFSLINETLSHYDLGWCYFTPQTENLRNTLPNKFFDYVQAGLGIIAGPNTDMIIESSEWKFGFFSRDYSKESLIKLLNELTPKEVKKAKQGAIAAKEKLVWDVDEVKFLDMFRQIGVA